MGHIATAQPRTKDGGRVSNGQTSAKKVEEGPDLEVVDGEIASVVEPKEIEALLDEMAKKNDEFAASEAASDSESVSETESSSADGPAQVEPTVVEPAEAPVSETGPSFTMADVLKAASESTSIPVDEIQNFERDEVASVDIEDSSDEGLEPTKGINEDDDLDEVPMREERQTPEFERSEPLQERSETESDSDDSASMVSRFKVPSWAIPTVGLAVLAISVLALAKVMGMENHLKTNDARIAKSLEATAVSMESLSTRLADIDRALTDGSAQRKVDDQTPRNGRNATHANASSSGSGSSPKSTSHGAKPSANSKAGDDYGAAKALGKGKGQTAGVKPSKPKPLITGPSGDHYNEAALVEGFKGSKLLIAKNGHGQKPRHVTKRHPSKRKVVKRQPVRQSTLSNSVRVYDASGRRIN